MERPKYLLYIIALEKIFSRTIEFIMTLFFIVIFIVIFILVLLRYGFSKSLFGGAELVTLLFIYASALGAALLYREEKHIRISFFVEQIPIKIRKPLIVCVYGISVVFHIMLFYLSGDWIATTGQYKTAILGVPYWVMQYSIPVYAFIVVGYLIRNILLVLLNNMHLQEGPHAEIEGLSL